VSNYPTYKIYIRSWDGIAWNYYFFTKDTGVDSTTTKTELEYTPDGWRESKFGWQRGWVYKGVMRSYSLPLKFINDGAKILRHMHYTYGIEANCELLVELWNPQTYTYSTLFRGDFDFTQMVDSFDSVTITINEGGFPAKLKARESTNYQYRIDNDPDVVWLKVPSIDLQSTLRFSIIDYVFLQAFGAGTYPRLVYIDLEGTNQELTPYDVGPPTTAHFIRNHSASTFDVDIKIKCRVKITTPGGNSSNGYFKLHRTVWNTNSSGTVIGIASSTDIYASVTPQTPGTLVEYVLDQTDTISLSQYQIVGYSFDMTLFGGGGSVSDGFETTFTTGEVYVYHVGATASQYRPSLPASRLFELLIESISDGDDHAVTTLCDTTYNGEIYFSSGDGVRGLEEPYIKTNLRDFFDFFDSLGGAMLDYVRSSNNVRLIPLSAGFDQTQVLDIGEVKSCEVMPFTDLTWVNLRIGGPSKTLDEVNGKHAVNMTSEFMSPVTKFKADKDMVSAYVTEMYDIVLTMQNLTGKETIDSDSDNDVIAFHATALGSAADGTFTIEPAGTITDYYDVYKKAIDLTPGANYWEIQNVFAPEKLFNIMFTPKRRLLNNGPVFRSSLYNSGASYVKFQMNSKNKANDVKMITLEGITPTIINEGSDELIGTLCADGDLLFLPYALNVTSDELINLYATIDGSPYKYITFTYLGITSTIFLLDTEVQPADRAEWKIKGLMTPIDDPLNLIR